MNKRLLVIGDSARLHTGFAQVIRKTIPHFQSAGWDVHQLCCLDVPPFIDARPLYDMGITPYFPPGHDLVGLTIGRDVFDHVKPDAVFMNMDAGTAYAWLTSWLPQLATDVPTLFYGPLEGSPVDPRIGEAFSLVEGAAVATEWGRQRLAVEYALDVPAVPHGVDTGLFRPFKTEGARREARRALGWEGRFVVIYVAQNRRRKNQERLIRALARVHELGHQDVLLYLHCKPEPDGMQDGWNLRHVAHCADVAQHVVFPDQERSTLGEERYTLAQKYAAADLYVHAAGVEGFGLPLLEAMASGLPIVIPDDQGNMSEVAGDAALLRVGPSDLEAWHTGALLTNCPPEGFAGAIILAKEQRNSAGVKTAITRGLERATLFSWDAMAERLTQLLEEAAERARARRSILV